MLCIKKPSVASAFNELIPKILKDGEVVETEFEERTKEIRNTIIEITNPKLKKVPEKYPLGEKAVEEYTKNLLYGSKNVFSYDYHQRLFEYPYADEKINQIDYIIEKLNQQKNSRRAVAITWNPKIDIEVSRDERGSVPCLQLVQFLIRNGKLYQTVIFRSNDALLAFVSNAIGLITLGEYIAKKVGVGYGTYTHHAISMHIYVDRDFDYIKKYFPECLKYLWWLKMGVRKKVSDRMINEFIRLYLDEKWSISEIANYFGLHHETVRYHLKKKKYSPETV